MKTDPGLFPLFRPYQKNPKKTYIWKFRIYPSCLYARLDRWLNKMSLSGWHVVDIKLGFFLFEQGKAEDKHYFCYTPTPPRNDGGTFSIPMRYPFLEQTYGVKKKYSPLNKNQSKTLCVIEVDPQKMQSTGYHEMLHDRNRLYALRTLLYIFVLALIPLIGFLHAKFGKA